jgi:hypothetical protein
VAHPTLGSHVQVYDVVEGADPIRIGGGDVPDAVDGEAAGVMSGGAGRIRKRFLSEFDGGYGEQNSTPANKWVRVR